VEGRKEWIEKGIEERDEKKEIRNRRKGGREEGMVWWDNGRKEGRVKEMGQNKQGRNNSWNNGTKKGKKEGRKVQ
jgi:hypothetical protein